MSTYAGMGNNRTSVKSVMHSPQAVLTSACGLQHSEHIRVTDEMFVKSSKGRTIVPCEHDAKSRVIKYLSPVFMVKRASEQQIASGFTPQGMVLQGPNEARGVAIIADNNSR